MECTIITIDVVILLFKEGHSCLLEADHFLNDVLASLAEDLFLDHGYGDLFGCFIIACATGEFEHDVLCGFLEII